MITKTIRNCLFAATLGLPSTLALAIEMPRQGMSMDEVRSTYGNPERDLGAVGKPAITRWVYDGYTVYFEGRRVVHTVRTQSLRGSASAAAAPSGQPAYEPAPVTPDLSAAYEEAPAPAFTPEPVAPAPYASEPAPAIAAPALAPEPDAAPAPAPSTSTSVGGGFRFDPVTGRLIIDSDTPPAEEPAAEPATAPESDAFAAPTEESGVPAEESMNDEPVTGEPAPTEPSPFAEPATEPAPAFAEPAAEPAFAEPTAEPAPASTEPASAAAESPGNALDDTLEFDPETGTFRPRQ